MMWLTCVLFTRVKRKTNFTRTIRCGNNDLPSSVVMQPNSLMTCGWGFSFLSSLSSESRSLLSPSDAPSVYQIMLHIRKNKWRKIIALWYYQDVKLDPLNPAYTESWEQVVINKMGILGNENVIAKMNVVPRGTNNTNDDRVSHSRLATVWPLGSVVEQRLIQSEDRGFDSY